MAKLTAIAHDRIWGTTETLPWFSNPEKRQIGEVWFDVPDTCPLLVKFLFTSSDLSVQVHPGDTAGSRGKTEMWHVLRAEPYARVALGVKREVSRNELRDACLSGQVIDLLNWVSARVGDTFFIPAGTVHALGGGLVVCEVQQNSDCTYRMYDYGRGRELHLEKGLAVSTLKPYSGRATLPVECKYFKVALDDRTPPEGFVVALEGCQAGSCWHVSTGESVGSFVEGSRSYLMVRENR